MRATANPIKFAAEQPLVFLTNITVARAALFLWSAAFTVPLALAGALFSLWYFNQTINIFSQIGMIMLIGLVTKNGILIVEFANQLQREQGMDKRRAIERASTIRLRPILMTTSTTILGLLPLAMGFGEGAEVRSPMAITVIGGLTVSTLLTLIIIPVVYSLFDRGQEM